MTADHDWNGGGESIPNMQTRVFGLEEVQAWRQKSRQIAEFIHAYRLAVEWPEESAQATDAAPRAFICVEHLWFWCAPGQKLT